MRRMQVILSCAVIVLIAHQTASAKLVVVDTVGVDIAGTAYIGGGVLDTSSRTWELETSSGDTFSLAGSTVTITGGGGQSSFGDAAIDLFDDYQSTSTNFQFLLTGLDPSLTYNIVYYGALDLSGSDTDFFMTDPSLATKSTSGAQVATFAENVNYVRYDGLSAQPSDDRLRMVVVQGVLNGFEIQALAQSAPEPSTLVLAAFGFVGLTLRRRHKRA